jgi:hypothetical protein
MVVALQSGWNKIAAAENWPQFRGPTRQRLSTEQSASLHWSAESNFVWKAEIPGEGWASPSVWNDKVFLTTTADRNETAVVEAGPEFKVAAKNPLGEKCQASIAVSQGELFIRTEKNHCCTGKIRR